MSLITTEENKIVIYKKKQNKKVSYKSINIYPKTFEALSKLRKQTGWGMAVLVEAFVDYCIEKVEVREVKE